ncbi:hypothetical protein SODALDRAFT_359024 [Sodiomyces alkalinus F11]|uniref:Uncharacterized protein n=1 Tax=Sodiomyces alkalinus (strain CBS 110278 / VKM F-3762 / F11) TaxID=1314773 RepID=A0A3N2PXE5_SODAK|nr:hypothetical protein SODALDRAFT_359024 [Sodiomyces alkalinus F11]ROT39157.1 hypothetical protein SODALDRAFT_359024 [Sodiomyces alkalinus F11]
MTGCRPEKQADTVAEASFGFVFRLYFSSAHTFRVVSTIARWPGGYFFFLGVCFSLSGFMNNRRSLCSRHDLAYLYSTTSRPWLRRSRATFFPSCNRIRVGQVDFMSRAWDAVLLSYSQLKRNATLHVVYELSEANKRRPTTPSQVLFQLPKVPPAKYLGTCTSVQASVAISSFHLQPPDQRFTTRTLIFLIREGESPLTTSSQLFEINLRC